MIIFLDGSPLVRSRVFGRGDLERKRRMEGGDMTSASYNRDWLIYTFNSKGRLSVEDDGTKLDGLSVVWVGLTGYNIENFNVGVGDSGLYRPDHEIIISGYSSFINTPLRNVRGLAKTLEKRGIPCLVPYPGNAAKSVGNGLWRNAKYISPALKRIRSQGELKEVRI